MGSASKIAVAVLLLLCTQLAFSQQMRLGKNPYTVEKSAVLELYSDNQGFLLPRIADTALINVMSPPDGMVIYFSPTQQVLIRANGYWQKITTAGSVVVSLNGNTGALTMDTSYISNFYQKVRGVLNAGSGINYNITTGTISNSGVLSVNGNAGTITIDTSYVANFSVKVRSLFSGTAPITYSNGLIGISQATTSTNGYLSNIDWNTFNSKANSFTNGNLTETGSGILTITGGTGSVIGSGTSIQVKQATTSQSGYLSNTDWNTFNNKLSSVDTTNISNFSVKVRSLFSGTAPITYSNGLIGITQATTSTNGYLSSADWNTFNNKLSSIDTTNISNFSVKVRSLFSGTAPITYSNGLIGISQVTTSTNGYLSSADWNTFNSKGSGSVTSVSVVSANGVSGSVATPTTTPAITLTLGAITPTSVAATGTVTGSNLSGTNTGNVTIGTANGLSITAGQVLSMALANTSTTGALSNTDWNTFNNKLSSIDTTNISNFSVKVRSLFSGTAPITYSNGLIGISQATTSTNGYLSSADWNTFNNKLSSIDTTNISNFSVKVRSLFSGTAPITYSNGLIGITQATTSANGYLSSADWNTFNNKLSSIDTTNISNFSVKVRSLFSGTAPITYSNGLIGITQANTSTNGYLSSTDWNTFNNKQGSGNYLSDPSGNGIVTRTSLNTTVNRTITGTANRITLTNGDGVSGNPTIDVGSNIVDKTVATTYTSGAKQTFVNSATTSGLNLTASADPSTPASGDFWNSTTTANSLKYRDASATTRTLVDLSLSQTLTNKTITSSTNVLGGVTMTLGSDATGDLYYRNSSGVLTRLGIGSNGDRFTVVGGIPAFKTPVSAQSTPADPSTTTSTTGVMMGLAGSIIPGYSGKIMIVISGDIDNGTANDGAQVQVRYGTGTAPTNGAILTGTTVGSLIKMVSSSATNRMPFHCNAIVSGLTVGTTYWIDLSLAAMTGGTARIRDVSISAIEL